MTFLRNNTNTTAMLLATVAALVTGGALLSSATATSIAPAQPAPRMVVAAHDTAPQPPVLSPIA